MTREEARAANLAHLAKANPHAKPAALMIYADARDQYDLAQRSVAEHGPVVLHPRTGAPIENPLLRARDAAGKVILAVNLRCDTWIAGAP